ncbi:MAG: YHYH protein [Ignavibacteria bacterium]|nr:YHYH protein [Ignavibacteria bacterium]
MKALILLALLCFGSSEICAQTNPAITSWMINTTNIMGRHYVKGNSTPVNDNVLANVQTVQYSATSVYVSTKGIPAYITGPFLDGNPSLATNQNAIFKIPLSPVQNTGTPTATTGGNIGIFVNGVAMFDYRDGVSWQNSTKTLKGGPLMGMGDGVWNRDAVVGERIGFDCAKAHPAMGNYHHHQNPSAFSLDLKVISNVCDLYAADGLYAIDSTKHSPLLGFAYDGFPIYGAYSYKNVDGTGGIVRMKSSFTLRTTMTARTTYYTGATVTAGPDVSATYPLGYFREDYQYTTTTSSTPDYLDEHNGRFCVTPEYPSGIYCYFATVDENWNSAYPYLIGPTFYGVRSASKVASISESVTTYTPSTSTLTVSTKALSIAALGGSTNTFDIAATVAWTITSSQPWLLASKSSGSGNETITLIAQENSSATPRSASVTVTGTGVAEQVITVTQAPTLADDSLIVTPSSVVFGAKDNLTRTITITTSGAWTLAIESPSWLSASAMSGTGNATITLTAQVNTGVDDRSTLVSIAAPGATIKQVNVLQSPGLTVLEVSKLVIHVGAAVNSSNFVDIESNTSWGIAIDPKSWVSLNKKSGIGSETVIVTTTEANPDTIARSGTFAVMTPDKSITISIVQAGKAPSSVSENTTPEPTILIYPNPASDLVAIQMNAINYENIDLQLYDAAGQEVARTTLVQGTTIAYFDTRTLYSGEYSVRMQNATGGVMFRKFILNK